MNKNDFRNPLIQSGAVLLVVFLLISIVASAGPHGMLGSIAALFSGLISGILFLIALFVGIVVCVAIIIALFIAAVSIHSVDKARDMYNGLKGSLCAFSGKVTEKFTALRSRPETEIATGHSTKSSDSAQSAGTDLAASVDKLQKKVARFEAAFTDMQAAQAGSASQLDSLVAEVNDLKKDSALAEISEQYKALAEAHKSLVETADKLASSVEAGLARLSDLEGLYLEDQSRVRAEIEKLHQKTSVPEVVTGILSYIDMPEDRDKITEKAEEAVSRGMTYAQIDVFFKSSLSPKVYKVLSEHPRLTKDFLRSVKKKFT